MSSASQRWLALLLLLTAAACSDAPRGQVAADTAGAAAAAAAIEHGRTLFRNKGCVTCHQHDRVEGLTGVYDVGPNLTSYRNSAELLRRWLAGPAEVKPGTKMPALGLTGSEIEDLIVFLNEPH